MISSAEALSSVTFSDEEKRSLAKLEAAIDSVIRNKYEGTPVRLQFDEVVSVKVMFALQRKYEEGGWKASVNLSAVSCSISLIPTAAITSVIKENVLPPIVPIVPSVDTQWRLLIRMPTRGRPLQALSILEKYRNLAGIPITLEVVLDEDDDVMLSGEVLQRLNALGCVITVGRHTNKIEAVNGGRVKDWDVLLLASDDMVPIAEGYGAKVLKAMEEHFPHLDGVIYFDDGYAGKRTCTLPIFGKRLYDQFGYVYDPSYNSLFCDNEQTEVLQAIGRLVYIDEKIIEHRHHVTGLAKQDSLYDRNDAFWIEDKTTYEKRKNSIRPNSQFGFNAPPLWLSICIATLPSRKEKLARLVDHIFSQTKRYPRQVEILTDAREQITIGEKRQTLLEKSKGQYVCFVDDDDWIAHNYIENILFELRFNPTVDCIALNGIMTTAGEVPERFENSIKHIEWKTENGVHLRSINHLNPVRRELALKAGFTPKSHAEDFDYSMALRSLLKTEASTGDKPLYYYWYWPGKTAC